MKHIDVQGHSGCRIEVVREGTELFVYKSTSDKGYLNRLCDQAAKQRQASAIGYRQMRVPAVLDVSRDETSAVIKMEYVYSRNFIEYFEQAEASQIHNLTAVLIGFIEHEVSLSRMTLVPANVMRDKFASVEAHVNANPLLSGDDEVSRLMSQMRAVFANCGDMMLPVGQCHGDLTFSNILFSGNNYYLIDFLDSFVETPLMDIVKLRQDTAYGWSQLMYTRHFDAVRQLIVNRKIDTELHAHFAKKYAWYTRYYGMMQLMNFLRILQYATDPAIVVYLKNTIADIYGNL